MQVLIFNEFGLFTPQKWRFFWGGDYTPQIVSSLIAISKGHLCVEARHMTYRSLRSVEPFLRNSSFYSTPTLCNGQYTPLKVPLFVGVSASATNAWFPGFTRLSVPNGILSVCTRTHQEMR